jgi:hypothetical protein
MKDELLEENITNNNSLDKISLLFTVRTVLTTI